MRNPMDFLSAAVLNTRKQQKLTQKQVAERMAAEAAESDKYNDRTVLFIEKKRKVPGFVTVFYLIRALRIDPDEIFYPEQTPDNPDKAELRRLIADCNASEAKALAPIIQSVLTVLRDRMSANETHEEKKSGPFNKSYK